MATPLSFPLSDVCQDSQKTKLFAGIQVNKAIETASMVCQAWKLIVSSILLRSVAWDLNIASSDLTICYTDGYLTGMAYYYPELVLEYQYCIATEDLGGTILLYEAVTVTAAIQHRLNCPCPQLTVHTNSHNTVNIWNSLKASQEYNDLLQMAIDSMLSNPFDICVLCVSGSDNLIANALSQGNNSYAQYLVPDLIIHSFKPPCDLLGPV